MSIHKFAAELWENKYAPLVPEYGMPAVVTSKQEAQQKLDIVAKDLGFSIEMNGADLADDSGALSFAHAEFHKELGTSMLIVAPVVIPETTLAARVPLAIDHEFKHTVTRLGDPAYAIALASMYAEGKPGEVNPVRALTYGFDESLAWLGMSDGDFVDEAIRMRERYPAKDKEQALWISLNVRRAGHELGMRGRGLESLMKPMELMEEKHPYLSMFPQAFEYISEFRRRHAEIRKIRPRVILVED